MIIKKDGGRTRNYHTDAIPNSVKARILGRFPQLASSLQYYVYWDHYADENSDAFTYVGITVVGAAPLDLFVGRKRMYCYKVHLDFDTGAIEYESYFPPAECDSAAVAEVSRGMKHYIVSDRFTVAGELVETTYYYLRSENTEGEVFGEMATKANPDAPDAQNILAIKLLADGTIKIQGYDRG